MESNSNHNLDLSKSEKAECKSNLVNAQLYIWRHMIQYIMNEKEILKILNHSQIETKKGNSEKYWKDHEAFENWLKNEQCAHFTILSSM